MERRSEAAGSCLVIGIALLVGGHPAPGQPERNGPGHGRRSGSGLGHSEAAAPFTFGAAAFLHLTTRAWR